MNSFDEYPSTHPFKVEKFPKFLGEKFTFRGLRSDM